MTLRIKKIFFLCSCLFLIACVEHENIPNYAWWYDIRANFEKDELNGLDVSDLSQDWAHARFLSASSFSRPLTNNESLELKNSGMTFHLKVDINNDSNLEDLYVGAYQTATNVSGMFLAIFDNGKLIKIFTHSSDTEFSALLNVGGNNIRWYKCLSCGDYDNVVSFDGGIYLE